MVRESFDIHFIIEKFPAILSALPVTLEITAVTLVLGWLLGLLVAWGKVSGSGWLKKFLRILTDIIRGIPTVVLLYIVSFGLPKLINVSNWSKISFVVLALSLIHIFSALEGACDTVAFASGMTAVAAVFEHFKPRDHVIWAKTSMEAWCGWRL